MELLASWTLKHRGAERTVELLRGDLSQLPPEHAVDILVVSAFANDYVPTHTSLIRALADRGISVAELALNKQSDLREQFSCWLSRPIEGNSSFKQILCIESGWRGSPPEIADDLFRGLAPYLLADAPNASVGMPLIGTGDQGWRPPRMMDSILRASVSWINRGLPLRRLKIVTRHEWMARDALVKFLEIREELSANPSPSEPITAPEPKPAESSQACDVFISYCHRDSKPVEAVLNTLQRVCPMLRVFHDHTSLRAGGSWLMQVAESLDSARRVMAFFTPHYWESTICKDEFTAAFTRQHDTGQPILFPVYFQSAPIPYLFRNLQFIDCREGDETKLAEACLKLATSI